MRNLIFTLVLFLVSVSVQAQSEFQIRPHETQKLENGLTILWFQDSTLPYISMQLMLRSGSAQDPAGKEGVAHFTAQMLEKGTPKRAALKIAEDFEQIGSSFDVEVEPDYTVISASSLSFNKEDLLAQFREVLLSPSFPLAEIERLRKLTLGSLQKLADRPQAFTDYLMPQFIFGRHPYGHESVGGPSSVRAIKKTDVVNFYSTHYQPGNAVLAVVGQFDEEFRKRVVQAFGGWKSRPAKENSVPAFPAWQGTEVLLVDRADLNQAQIQIGFKGVPRNFPEYLEMRAALKILGESFGSRLFEEIREKRGLTYHISAWFDPRLQPGPMGIYTFTRTDKIGETVDETLKTYREFVSKGVTDDELKRAKALMKGQFPRSFETPEALARQVLILNRYDVPVSYLTDYLKNVDGLTKEKVNQTITKFFDPTNLKVLVYAPRSKAEEPLKKMGKVEVKGYQEFLR